MPSSADHPQYVVLDHIVTPDTNEIALGEQVTRLEPKSMEVLVHLFAHAGEVVSRDQLQDAIWGDVIVGDDSLTNAIIKIRKAFKDDARNPRVIETIPKRGYRLIADVSPFVPQRAVERKSGSSSCRRGRTARGDGRALFSLLARQMTPSLRSSCGLMTVFMSPLRSFKTSAEIPTQDYLAQGVQQSCSERAGRGAADRGVSAGHRGGR